LKGYTDDLEERTVPPGMITRDALLGARFSDSIDLTHNRKLFKPWLEPAARQVKTQAEASQVVAPAVASQGSQPAPDLSRGETTAAAPLKSEVDAVIHEELLAEYEKALAAKDPAPPSAKDAGRILAPRVRARGHPNVGANRVQKLAEGEQYEPFRRRQGQHRMSEDQIAAAKKKLAELKAAKADGSF
jgi:hypothetical protein